MDLFVDASSLMSGLRLVDLVKRLVAGPPVLVDDIGRNPAT